MDSIDSNLCVYVLADDFQHLNVTVDSLLRQKPYLPKIYVIAYIDTMHVRSIIEHYGNTRIRYVPVVRPTPLVAEAKKLINSQKTRLASTIASGTVLAPDWVRWSLEELKAPELDAVYAKAIKLTDSGLPAKKQPPERGTAEEIFMQRYLGNTGIEPIIFKIASENLADAPHIPARAILSQVVFAGVRKAPPILTPFTRADIGRFIQTVSRSSIDKSVHALTTGSADSFERYCLTSAMFTKKLFLRGHWVASYRLLSAWLKKPGYRKKIAKALKDGVTA